MTLHIGVQNVAAFSSNIIKGRRKKTLRAKRYAINPESYVQEKYPSKMNVK